MLDIQVLYVAGCPNLSVLVDRLNAVTCGRVTVRMTEVDPDGIVPAGFTDSPSLLIDGTNPYGVGGASDGATCTLRIPSVAELKAMLHTAT